MCVIQVGLGSWPCENAGALRTRRTIFLSCAMFARPVVRRLGTRSAGRTRFPSVDVLSGFSHGQGQGPTNHHPCRRSLRVTVLPPATDPIGGSLLFVDVWRSVPDSVAAARS